jgi:hypothetical protein
VPLARGGDELPARDVYGRPQALGFLGHPAWLSASERAPFVEAVHELRRHWFWFFLLGVLLIVLGLVAHADIGRCGSPNPVRTRVGLDLATMMGAMLHGAAVYRGPGGEADSILPHR